MTPEATSTTLRDRIAHAGHDWLLPDWPLAASDAVGAIATTRNGGVSLAPWATLNLAPASDDSAAARDENLRRVAQFLPAPPVLLRQVHGRAAIILDRSSGARARSDAPVADAAVTAVPGVVCAVLTADCLPVLFCDDEARVVGAAHAGWRGLAAGVLESTIAAMASLGAPAYRLAAWLGPAIGPRAFEVGADVVDAFCQHDAGAASAFVAHAPGKWRADLYALARRRLASAGVTQVSGGNCCTFTEGDRFFSYRRDGDTGRQAAFIWRQPLTAADGRIL